MKKHSIALVSALALGIAACSQPTDDTTDTTTDDVAVDDTTGDMADDTAEVGTIVEVAQGNPDFSTLVKAVTAANLADTLSGDGPFTVFAPTDTAFAKLPDGTVEELTTTATDKLGDILKYHVVEGKVDSAALAQAIKDAGEDGYEITTVNGAKLTAMMDGDNVVLKDAAGNTATVTNTDVDASNGVIHVIDTVLMPE